MAQALSTREQRKALEILMLKSATATEVATTLGWALDATVYRIKKLLLAGLIEVVQEEKRKGRAIKHYRATSGAYRIRLSVLPFADQVEVFRTLDDPLRSLALQGLARSTSGTHMGQWFMRFYVAEGRVLMDLAPTEQDWQFSEMTGANYPAVMLNWLPMHLSAEEAKALQRELMALLMRYQSKGDPQQFNHLLGILLAPATPG
ncbi:hypothetical protein DC3_30960 [Deinococcus cellulosilyticus NBRC 106333 = KACC 11606]|uniref:Uncharacterized protein n=2 Tax=Deinococcus cellulosilyticus TaxID=401558 RepID=A0A511N4W9_DEIC1|nr:hypothetical protein DC3_30960 [Deinococcus cellulosilyticus NBRC 106333 = KACC 11606]